LDHDAVNFCKENQFTYFRACIVLSSRFPENKNWLYGFFSPSLLAHGIRES